jgi:hypothetical protein
MDILVMSEPAAKALAGETTFSTTIPESAINRPGVV